MSDEGRAVPVLNYNVVKQSNGLICLVENCNKDLQPEKKYYQRHCICKEHLKANKILVEGKLQRFCQQCGKFHDIDKFDKDKRSCREGLKKHKQNREEKQLKKSISAGSGESLEPDVTPTEREKRGIKRQASSAGVDSYQEDNVKRYKPEAVHPQLKSTSSAPIQFPEFHRSRPKPQQFIPYQQQQQQHHIQRQQSEPRMHIPTPLTSYSAPVHAYTSMPISNFPEAATQQLYQECQKLLQSGIIPVGDILNYFSQQQQQSQSIQSNKEENNININIEQSKNIFGNIVSSKKVNDQKVNNNIFDIYVSKENEEQQIQYSKEQSQQQQQEQQPCDLMQVDDVESDSLPAECYFDPQDGVFDSDGLLDLTKIKISNSVQLYKSLQDDTKPDYCYIRDERQLNL